MPLLTLSAASKGLPHLIRAIELAAKARSRAIEKKTALQFGVTLWGAVLFEMRTNSDRALWISQQAEEGRISFGLMSFEVADALMPEFCKAVPYPITLNEMQRVSSCLRRIDFFQRVGGANASSETSKDNPSFDIHGTPAEIKYRRAIAFARDFKEKRHPQRFNDLVETANALGSKAYGAEWDQLQPAILPNPIDVKGPPSVEFL